MGNIITVPFGWLLGILYQLTANYGVAMILFTIFVKLILAPITAKSKKASMKMSRISPLVQDIQKRYEGDQQKMNEALQNLYKEEGVSMGAGCLWSLIPLLILFPLLSIIREPIVYLLHESADNAAKIVEVIKTNAPNLFSGNEYYNQVVGARHIADFAAQIKEAIPGISAETLAGINFDFFGIDLGLIPQWNIFASDWAWDWAHIGGAVIPLLSAGTSVLSMFIMQKLNNSVVTDKNGVHDEETAKKSQTNQSTNMMLWMMPLMSLWIGFTVPGGLSLYWLVQGLVAIILDVILTLHYRKVYDAEDAVRLQRMMEREREEAERERIRAERRAANPEGQTQNTSKKKLQQKQRAEEEAERAAAAKEYNAKKGIVEEEAPQAQVMSGIPERPYCKGRNYDPNRYANSTEE
jgi:YidC/Oxa1 family membrane protein insertase